MAGGRPLLHDYVLHSRRDLIPDEGVCPQVQHQFLFGHASCPFYAPTQGHG